MRNEQLEAHAANSLVYNSDVLQYAQLYTTTSKHRRQNWESFFFCTTPSQGASNPSSPLHSVNPFPVFDRTSQGESYSAHKIQGFVQVCPENPYEDPENLWPQASIQSFTSLSSVPVFLCCLLGSFVFWFGNWGIVITRVCEPFCVLSLLWSHN